MDMLCQSLGVATKLRLRIVVVKRCDERRFGISETHGNNTLSRHRDQHTPHSRRDGRIAKRDAPPARTKRRGRHTEALMHVRIETAAGSEPGFIGRVRHSLASFQ